VAGGAAYHTRWSAFVFAVGDPDGAVPRPTAADGDTRPVHLLVDSTGLKLCGAGEWLVEKHGTKTRRSWRKLHLGVDAETGQIVASALTRKEVDDGVEVSPLLDQLLFVHR
jgi:hypothetical protein